MLFNYDLPATNRAIAELVELLNGMLPPTPIQTIFGAMLTYHYCLVGTTADGFILYTEQVFDVAPVLAWMS